jgi:predicted PurR-regulated permease PerM
LIGGGITALVAMAFIMLESDSINRRLKKGLGNSSEVLHRMRLFQKSLVSYVIARLKLNFLTGLGVLIMLLLFGVDFAWLWGLLAFLLSFIPYIGLFVAAIPAVLLGIAESGITVGIILGVGYFVINQVIEQVVEPKIVGAEMQLSPTIMFFSVIFSAWLLGPIGAMLAGPLVALTTIVFSAFDETRWLAILFSSEDSPLVTGEEMTGASDNH